MKLKLSVSSMGTYHKCPKKYQYHYIERPPVEKKTWTHLDAGTLAHRVLELFHLDLVNNVRPTTEYASLAARCFKQAVTEFDFERIKTIIPDVKIDIQDYLDKIKLDGLPQVLGTETKYSKTFGDYLVAGFIDRIDREAPGVYRVVDYKTSKDPKYLDKFQLAVYACAVKDMYPDAHTIHGSYVLLKHKSKFLSWTFTEKDFEETTNKIIQTGEDIISGRSWAKKPSALCRFCDYYELCQEKKQVSKFENLIGDDIFSFE
jgi:RecB family exonuclease